jgi:hypothetical protein
MRRMVQLSLVVSLAIGMALVGSRKELCAAGLIRDKTLCANIAETFTPQLIRVEGGEVFDHGSTYC